MKLKGFSEKTPEQVEAEALARIERSTNAAWYVNYQSRIPARVQLWFIRIWLWCQ